MNGVERLILGTRGSSLALTQATMVEEALRIAHPELVIERKVITTTGDRRTDVPLADVAKSEGIIDKGIFLKEIEQALEDGEIDFAVHSLKDMPSELDKAFDLAAVLPRACVEDVLVSKKPAHECYRIATGSVRRRFMGRRHFGPHVQFPDLRGNVPTRLGKLVASEELDGVILARAGLDRLGLFAESTKVDGVDVLMTSLPLDAFVPAAGQGIIGLEIRRGDDAVQKVLSSINDLPAWRCALAERTFLRFLGANCSTPVGVHAHLLGEEKMRLSVVLFDEAAKDVSPYTCIMDGEVQDPEGLAHKMWGTLMESGFSSKSRQV